MHLPIASCNSYDSFVLSNLLRASIAPWLHAARLPFRKYNIPNIQVCGLMGRFWIVLCLVVNIYNIQIPVIRMKYHPSVIWQFVHILFLSFNFNLYAFRGTDALQPPNSHMLHKHPARAQTTKWTWVLERREICLVHDAVVVLFLAMLKEFLS